SLQGELRDARIDSLDLDFAILRQRGLQALLERDLTAGRRLGGKNAEAEQQEKADPARGRRDRRHPHGPSPTTSRKSWVPSMGMGLSSNTPRAGWGGTLVTTCHASPGGWD